MAGLAGVSQETTKAKLDRCLDWLQKQNELIPKKLSLQNQNDIQFIIECNAQRRKFLLSTAEDDTTIPAGVDEPPVEPLKVPLKRLRVENLRMLCEWNECEYYFTDYKLFQEHVAGHLSHVKIIGKGDCTIYACLWDICGHKTSDFMEMTRHINFHAYHAKLLSIGFNGRATLNLERCQKDSSHRNSLPPLNTEHKCLWVDCTAQFNSIQVLFEHVKAHARGAADESCSWAGCGAAFPRRALLYMHVRTHTNERLIACYHCGRHFATNSRLKDHLDRQQNVTPDTGHVCHMCNLTYATASLLREHTRSHVSAYACHLCDMTAPSPGALAMHVLYKHLSSEDIRTHACPECPYKAITKGDLHKHLYTHARKRKRAKGKGDDSEPSDEEDKKYEMYKRKKTPARKYACHMCPGKKPKVFTRGTRLTRHLVKEHDAQWPFGISRFRYQLSSDGMYRLNIARTEYLELSEEIESSNGPKATINKDLKFEVRKIAEATEWTPNCFEVVLKNDDNSKKDSKELKIEDDSDEKTRDVEITMCDVDEDGNILSSKVINSVVFA